MRTGDWKRIGLYGKRQFCSALSGFVWGGVLSSSFMFTFVVVPVSPRAHDKV